MKVVTNMRGLSRWITAHPRKNLYGFFTVNGKPLTHEQVLKVVSYCVKKGYETEENLPDNELTELLKED